jgi:drug/metabolite transporter (DMT)-like permease
VLLAPFMATEVAVTGRFPSTPAMWASVIGLAVFASICAFLSYQYAVKKLGPTITGLTLYGMPVAGVGLAVALLGERPGPAIFAGSALVIGGVALATLPRDLLASTKRRRPAPDDRAR